MIRIDKLCGPQFDDIAIIDSRLVKGAEEHVGRMTMDNIGGAKDAMILSTNTKITALKNLLSKDELDSTNKESLGILTDANVVSLRASMRRNYGLLISIDGIADEVIHDFFPNKLYDVNHLTKANYFTTLDRLISASNTHSGIIGIATHDEYVLLKTTIDINTDLLTDKKALVVVDDSQQQAKSKILRDQLSDNVCDLAKMYRLVPDKAASYFTQSTFFGDTHHTHHHDTGSFHAQERVVAYHATFAEGTDVLVRSRTAGKISGYILDAATDAFISKFTVNGDSSHTYHSQKIGGLKGTYLVLMNDNLAGGPDGIWEIDIID